MFRNDSTPVQDPPRTGASAARWWHSRPDARIVCDLCPRACTLKEGDRGFCFVRQNVGGQMALTTYGRSTGFCIDPVEKKPLNHFYPGSSVLSFGTAGCCLGCKFCQNWSTTKSREIELLSAGASPVEIAEAAQKLGCRSVAFTYNDPIIWAEYAIDTARACHERGIKTIAKTSGYICPEARSEFFAEIDAANIDLKAITEDFYRHTTLSHLQPVLDTLRWVRHETEVWLEVTNLLIPGANDDPDEIRQLADWILQNLGDDVPVHFTAFRPDFRMQDRPPTPLATLTQAQGIARKVGLRYVYTGNVRDPEGQRTLCPSCGAVVVERIGFRVAAYRLRWNCCAVCGATIPGCFGEAAGTWQSGCQPIDIQEVLDSEPCLAWPAQARA